MRDLGEGIHRRFDDAQRGATVAQYAVVVVLVAIAAVLGVRQLGRGGSETFEEANAGVEDGTAPSRTGGSGGGGSGSGGSGGGGGGGPIVIPTTSSTLPPITTTSTTTSTTAPVVVSGATFTASGADYVSSSYWRATASAVVRSASGDAIAGATVQLTVRMQNYSTGDWTQTTVTLTADEDGVVSYTSDDLPRRYSGRIQVVELTVYSVSGPGGVEWDGTAPYVSITRP